MKRRGVETVLAVALAVVLLLASPGRPQEHEGHNDDGTEPGAFEQVGAISRDRPSRSSRSSRSTCGGLLPTVHTGSHKVLPRHPPMEALHAGLWDGARAKLRMRPPCPSTTVLHMLQYNVPRPPCTSSNHSNHSSRSAPRSATRRATAGGAGCWTTRCRRSRRRSGRRRPRSTRSWRSC
jgi:hypothetical protein